MSALEQALFTRRRHDATFTSTGLVFHSDAGIAVHRDRVHRRAARGEHHRLDRLRRRRARQRPDGIHHRAVQDRAHRPRPQPDPGPAAPRSNERPPPGSTGTTPPASTTRSARCHRSSTKTTTVSPTPPTTTTLLKPSLHQTQGDSTRRGDTRLWSTCIASSLKRVGFTPLTCRRQNVGRFGSRGATDCAGHWIGAGQRAPGLPDRGALVRPGVAQDVERWHVRLAGYLEGAAKRIEHVGSTRFRGWMRSRSWTYRSAWKASATSISTFRDAKRLVSCSGFAMTSIAISGRPQERPARCTSTSVKLGALGSGPPAFSRLSACPSGRG